MSDTKVAIVTGGSRGIGRVAAIKLAKKGFNVAICYAGNEEKANETIGIIEELGVKAKAYKCDVSNSAQVESTVKEISEDFDSIDVLVNNAGITRDGLLIRMSEDDFDAVIARGMIRYHIAVEYRTGAKQQIYRHITYNNRLRFVIVARIAYKCHVAHTAHQATIVFTILNGLFSLQVIELWRMPMIAEIDYCHTAYK